MWECGRVKVVWDELGWEDDLESIEWYGFTGWVNATWETVGAEGRELFMMVCWLIWQRRNSFVFEGHDFRGEGLVEKARELLIEGESAREEEHGSARATGDSDAARSDIWRPSSDGLLKLNVDASIMDGRGMGVGMVARDGGGHVV
ncbi:hypothetical protein RND81_14G071300 [Saponaria officinalis]|uniref:Uncharacterized protein n=1 Tax=Saponaria officinalis TaxID=3572 RepID=A0AAW1GMA5_SAPOF